MASEILLLFNTLRTGEYLPNFDALLLNKLLYDFDTLY